MTDHDLLLDKVLQCEIIGGNIPRETCEECAYCLGGMCHSELLLAELIMLVKDQEKEIQRLKAGRASE